MRAPLTSICLVVATGMASAQRLAVYDPAATGGPGFLEVTAPTMLVPPGSPPVLIYPDAPALPPPMMANVGDSTFDGANGYHLYTNGLLVAGMPTPAFPPVGAPLPVVPIPAAVLGAIGGGPVTGMAIAPGGLFGAPILWLVGAPGIVVGVSPAAPLPIVVPAFPIGFVLRAPITGLEWDSLTARLLAVDALGTVYPFFPGGAPAGALIPAPAAALGVASDVAIDKTGMMNAWGVRSIYVLFGPVYADVTAPGPLPPLYITGGSPNASGLAFLPHPAANPVMGVCPCPNFAMTQSVIGPMTAGNPGFGFRLSGLPPGQLAIVAFDFFYNPGFPLINGIGCGFGLLFGSPTLVANAMFADPFGVATYPLPLLLPPGCGPIFYQAGTFCPADPVLGAVITPMYQFAACGM